MSRRPLNHPERAERLRDPARIRRFMALVGKPDSRGHWPWRGHRDSKGYGQFWTGERAAWAHRIAFSIFSGPVPAGKQIDHKCGNPSCVNPEHLRTVTPAQNSANKPSTRKRRQPRRRPSRSGAADYGDIPV